MGKIVNENATAAVGTQFAFDIFWQRYYETVILRLRSLLVKSSCLIVRRLFSISSALNASTASISFPMEFFPDLLLSLKVLLPFLLKHIFPLLNDNIAN